MASIEQFLTLTERMEVAILVSNDARMRCAGIGVIDECSPRGVWCGFLVPHNFFVVVIVTKVSTECEGQIAYCKEESITTLGAAINHRVLRSWYKVRPTEPLCPSCDAVVKEECIGGPPIHFHPDMGVRFLNSQQVLKLLLTCEGILGVSKHKNLTIILRKWQRR